MLVNIVDGIAESFSVVTGAERVVTTLYARSVFFVADAEASLRFYTKELGFSLDWDSKTVCFR